MAGALRTHDHDGATTSLWMATTPAPRLPALDCGDEAQVCIIGGAIRRK